MDYVQITYIGKNTINTKLKQFGVSFIRPEDEGFSLGVGGVVKKRDYGKERLSLKIRETSVLCRNFVFLFLFVVLKLKFYFNDCLRFS